MVGSVGSEKGREILMGCFCVALFVCPALLWRMDLSPQVKDCATLSQIGVVNGLNGLNGLDGLSQVACAKGAPLTGSAAVLFEQKLDLNNASWRELAAVPGVSKNTARAIVGERFRGGPFRSVQELTRVPGIGVKTSSRLQAYVEIR